MRQNPDKVTAGFTQGNGTTSHLTAELFQLMAKVKLQSSFPIADLAPALQGLLAGDVDLMFDNLGVSLPLVRGVGNLKLLGRGLGEGVSPSLPEVPTIAETLPGFEAVAWYAIVAPPATPKGITDKINADVNEALRQPDIQDRLKKLLGVETFGGSTASTAQYLRMQEVERWGSGQGGGHQVAADERWRRYSPRRTLPGLRTTTQVLISVKAASTYRT